MAAKLGSTDVSFRLGATEVSKVYLGTQEVWSAVQAATLYYNNAEGDELWTTVGNWWLDAGHTEPAGRLPSEIDSVVASANITPSGQTVVNFTLGNGALFGPVTVTGNATFNEGSQNLETLTGNATFNSAVLNSGTITGDATFNDDSGSSGTVNGNATFNDSSINFSTVNGNAIFNDSSLNYGTITGTATFTGSACNSGGTAGTFVPNPPPSC